MFEVRGRPSSVEFSPDESRLLLKDMSAAKLTIIDVATRKPTMTVGSKQLDPGNRMRGFLSKAVFGSNDTVCFVFTSDTGGRSVLGVFDLAQNKATHVREVGETVNTMLCDPAGEHMVRTLSDSTGGHGMEIWDLATDKITAVKAPIVNILGIEPAGRYASVLAFDNGAQGFYDLATGKKGYPPTVPDGYWVLGARVRNTSGGLVSQDVNPNAYRDWPDESLYGPGLVEHALAALTDAQRDEVARERIIYTVVAGNR